MKNHYDLEIMKFLLLANDEINIIDEGYKYLFTDNIKTRTIRDKLLTTGSKIVIDECASMSKKDKVNYLKINN
jgi:hypothetical protein